MAVIPQSMEKISSLTMATSASLALHPKHRVAGGVEAPTTVSHVTAGTSRGRHRRHEWNQIVLAKRKASLRTRITGGNRNVRPMVATQALALLVGGPSARPPPPRWAIRGPTHATCLSAAHSSVETGVLVGRKERCWAPCPTGGPYWASAGLTVGSTRAGRAAPPPPTVRFLCVRRQMRSPGNKTDRQPGRSRQTHAHSRTSTCVSTQLAGKGATVGGMWTRCCQPRALRSPASPNLSWGGERPPPLIP